MAEQPEQPGKRWVLVSMLHGAVERTEEQIEELKAGRLFTRDASGPDDNHDRNPAEGGQAPPASLGAPPAAPKPAEAKPAP